MPCIVENRIDFGSDQFLFLVAFLHVIHAIDRPKQSFFLTVAARGFRLFLAIHSGVDDLPTHVLHYVVDVFQFNARSVNQIAEFIV